MDETKWVRRGGTVVRSTAWDRPEDERAWETLLCEYEKQVLKIISLTRIDPSGSHRLDYKSVTPSNPKALSSSVPPVNQGKSVTIQPYQRMLGSKIVTIGNTGVCEFRQTLWLFMRIHRKIYVCYSCSNGNGIVCRLRFFFCFPHSS